MALLPLRAAWKSPPRPVLEPGVCLSSPRLEVVFRQTADLGLVLDREVPTIVPPQATCPRNRSAGSLTQRTGAWQRLGAPRLGAPRDARRGPCRRLTRGLQTPKRQRQWRTRQPRSTAWKSTSEFGH